MPISHGHVAPRKPPHHPRSPEFTPASTKRPLPCRPPIDKQGYFLWDPEYSTEDRYSAPYEYGNGVSMREGVRNTPYRIRRTGHGTYDMLVRSGAAGLSRLISPQMRTRKGGGKTDTAYRVRIADAPSILPTSLLRPSRSSGVGRTEDSHPRALRRSTHSRHVRVLRMCGVRGPYGAEHREGYLDSRGMPTASVQPPAGSCAATAPAGVSLLRRLSPNHRAGHAVMQLGFLIHPACVLRIHSDAVLRKTEDSVQSTEYDEV